MAQDLIGQAGDFSGGRGAVELFGRGAELGGRADGGERRREAPEQQVSEFLFEAEGDLVGAAHAY